MWIMSRARSELSGRDMPKTRSKMSEQLEPCDSEEKSEWIKSSGGSGKSGRQKTDSPGASMQTGEEAKYFLGTGGWAIGPCPAKRKLLVCVRNMNLGSTEHEVGGPSSHVSCCLRVT